MPTPGRTHPSSRSSMSITFRNAAQIAYNIVEIRREILRFLPPSDLASFLRVEQGCMRDVVRALYYEVEYPVAEALVLVVSDRRDLYAAAVRKIDARDVRVSDELLQHSHRDDELTHPPFFQGQEIRYYSEEIANLLIPLFLYRFPALQTLVLGRLPVANKERTACGVIDFDPRPPGASITQNPSTPGVFTGNISGSINFTSPEMCDGSDENPPKLLGFPKAPKGHFRVHHRYDLILGRRRLEPGLISPRRSEVWEAAIQDGPLFAGLYKCLTVRRVPFHLESLSQIYERQYAAGYTERLEEINLVRVYPWHLPQFHSFATLAGPTLTSLILTKNDPTAYRDDRNHMSFCDLPALVRVIRGDLPHLRILHFGLKGIVGAEAACEAFLTVDSLEEGGTVDHLVIVTGDDATPDYSSPMFNIIRVISAICTSDADINIAGMPQMWSEEDQTEALQYLRRQPDAARRHLAVVDFTSLDLEHPDELCRLVYDVNGQPGWASGPATYSDERRRIDGWEDHADAAAREAPDDTETLLVAVTRLSDAGKQLRAIPSKAPTVEKVVVAQKFARALQKAKYALSAMENRLQAINQNEVLQYIGLLEEAVARGE